MTIWAAAFLGCAIGLVFYALFVPKKNKLEEKMRILQALHVGFDQTNPMEADFVSRVVKPLLGGITQRLGKRVQKLSVSNLEQRLALSGNPFSFSVDQYVSFKIVVSVVLTLVAVLLTTGLHGVTSSTFIWGVLGLVGGWFFPDMWLDNLRRRRQKAITMELPSILDILVVTTEAGLTFDSALRRICDNTQGVLTNEIKKTIDELALNIPRSQALRNLADRCGVDDLSIFVTSVIQAENTGTGISNALRAQAHRVREKVRQRIEEKGGKISVWLLFPTVFFIVPALFIIVLGGAVVDLSGKLF